MHTDHHPFDSHDHGTHDLDHELTRDQARLDESSLTERSAIGQSVAGSAEIGGVDQATTPHYLGEPIETVQLPTDAPTLHTVQQVESYRPPIVNDNRWGMTPEGVNLFGQEIEQQGTLPTDDTIGTPEIDASYWTYMGAESGYCGPDSISMVLSEFGIHASMDEIAGYAESQGEVTGSGAAGQIDPTPGDLGWGMSSEQIAAVLTHEGVPATATTGDYQTLVDALQNGRDVILSVDANQIWHNAPAGTPEGHAVVLTGIDPATGTAYLDDPGTPDGRMEAVPLTELMDAWHNDGYQMVETQQAPGLHLDSGASDAAASTQGGPILLPVTVRAGVS